MSLQRLVEKRRTQVLSQIAFQQVAMSPQELADNIEIHCSASILLKLDQLPQEKDWAKRAWEKLRDKAAEQNFGLTDVWMLFQGGQTRTQPVAHTVDPKRQPMWTMPSRSRFTASDFPAWFSRFSFLPVPTQTRMQASHERRGAGSQKRVEILKRVRDQHSSAKQKQVATVVKEARSAKPKRVAAAKSASGQQLLFFPKFGKK